MTPTQPRSHLVFLFCVGLRQFLSIQRKAIFGVCVEEFGVIHHNAIKVSLAFRSRVHRGEGRIRSTRHLSRGHSDPRSIAIGDHVPAVLKVFNIVHNNEYILPLLTWAE
jgi:hypothetical protein